MIDSPVFLVGAERSGSTLLRLMLDGHPQLAFNEEFEYAVDVMPESGGFPSMQDYIQHLELDRVFLSTGYQIQPGLSYSELVDSFLVQKRGAKSTVGATVHRHFDRLLRVWPDARFVHLLRDGRDVARSVIEMGWEGNVWSACTRWLEAEMLWDHVSALIPAARQITVRFEKLVAEPREQLARICEFLHLPYDEEMMRFPERSKYSAPNAKMAQSWKRKMEVADVQLAEARIGSMLAQRNYEMSGHPAIEVTDRMESRLARQSRRFRRSVGIKAYGLKLFLLNAFTRRARLNSWNRSIRLRLNAIENQIIK